jgi:hypothetical protein
MLASFCNAAVPTEPELNPVAVFNRLSTMVVIRSGRGPSSLLWPAEAVILLMGSSFFISVFPLVFMRDWSRAPSVEVGLIPAGSRARNVLIVKILSSIYLYHLPY